MRKLALVLGLLAAASVAQATLIYNNGGVNTVNTPQASQAGWPHIALSVDGTVVNWDPGAFYSSSIRYTGSGITLANNSSFNLNGGSIAVTGNTGLSELIGLKPSSYNGASSMSGGAFTLTEGYAYSAGVRFVSSLTDGTFNFSGGEVNLTERGSGNLRIVWTGGGNGVYTFSGTLVNATDNGVNTGLPRLSAFQAATGGSPLFYVTGGAFNLTSGEAIELFNMQVGTFSLSGGLISANRSLSGNTSGGVINLIGTFNIAPGTYDDARWVDATVITGTLADGSPFNLDGGLTITGAGVMNIIAVPEPSASAFAGLGALLLLAIRHGCRKSRGTEKIQRDRVLTFDK